jgi:hypothetical protein
LLRGDSTDRRTSRGKYTPRNEAMKTVYRAILQVGAAHPQYASVTIQSGTLRAIAGQWWVEMPGGYMLQHGAEWSDSESEAWDLAGGKISDIARDLLSRADDCRTRAADLQQVPA